MTEQLKTNEKYTTALAAPGAFLSAFLKACVTAEMMPIQQSEKDLRYRLSGIPIEVYLCGPSEANNNLDDISKNGNPANLSALMIGSDFLSERNQQGVWTIPLKELEPSTPKSSVQLFYTPTLIEKNPNPTLNDLTKGRIVTPLPNTVSRFFKQQGIPVPDMVIRKNKTERSWAYLADIYGVVDDTETWASSSANQLTWAATIMNEVNLVMQFLENISQQDKTRYEDMMSKFEQTTRNTNKFFNGNYWNS